jgi:hypothetical protein
MNNKQTMPSYLVELEHELADAHDRIRLLIAERDTARLQADQKINLREDFRELLGTDDIEQGVVVVRGLQDRIKRLEEAGDAMVSHAKALGMDGTGLVKRWFKAKEAKP